ncbi:MAG: hypothetical protein A2W33_00695 [Chloroflexi bacterium RBG_16_52_11]|nr:MAG: hypothetical protein A2W33_00695 [Chloroflexi bacterium RBG_16_52_11]
MQGSFTSQTYNISALLGRTSFPSYTAKRVVVPPFQRGYSWELSHVSTFWDDVFTFHQQRDKKGGQDTYFLGPIVILPENDCINLLDGQQRLATATILLAVIRDIGRARGGQPGSDLARDIQRDLVMVDDEQGILALTLGELDDPYFRSNVQEDPPTNSVKARLRSHWLILRAKNFLHTKIEELVSGLGPKELVTTLKSLQRTLASHLKLVAIEVHSEEEAFLIFETLNDRGLRLAVPDLVLNHLMRTAKSDVERKGIRQSWNSVVENLGQQKVSTFIRHMWVSRYGDVKSQGLFREIRDNLATQSIGSLEFAELCAAESNSYVAITDLNQVIIGEEALPHVDGLINYLESDRALPLLLSGIVCLEPGDFAKLARALATVVTRHSVLANLNPTILEDTLYSAARALRAKHKEGGNSKASLKVAKDNLRKVIPPREQIRGTLPQVFLTKKQAGYVLYALAEKVQSTTKAVKLSQNSIEHIFPENPDLTDWPKAEEMEPFIWHLGNLTVLEPTYNREAGRKSYDTKKVVYTKSDIAMTRGIPKNYNSWDVASILDRADKLLPLIEEVWPETI